MRVTFDIKSRVILFYSRRFSTAIPPSHADAHSALTLSLTSRVASRPLWVWHFPRERHSTWKPGTRVERHASLRILPETRDSRNRKRKSPWDSSDNSGDYQRNARFAFDRFERSPMSFGSGLSSPRSSLEKLSHDFSSPLGVVVLEAVIIGSSALLLGI